MNWTVEVVRVPVADVYQAKQDRGASRGVVGAIVRFVDPDRKTWAVQEIATRA